MSDLLKEVKEALAKATPGPWFTGTRGGQCRINHEHGKGDCVYDLVLNHSDDWVETTQPEHEIFEHDYDSTRIKRKDDAHLIANAPQWLASLVSQVEEMQIPQATEEDAKGGWRLSYKFLEQIEQQIEPDEYAPSIEGIELVLLAFQSLKEARA